MAGSHAVSDALKKVNQNQLTISKMQSVANSLKPHGLKLEAETDEGKNESKGGECDELKVEVYSVLRMELVTAVITAQSEISMGMSHDDDHQPCAGRSHIMSGEWVKGRNPSDLSWSSCSRDDLENFLKLDLQNYASMFVFNDNSDAQVQNSSPQNSKFAKPGILQLFCSKFAEQKLKHLSPGPGGKNCRGASVEHTVCENLPCPKGVPSFRDQQCQAHDRYTNKKKSLLTAVIIDDKPCELFCSPLGKDSPVLVTDRVLDGTPCGPYETDLCVHGKCQVE
ncbi:hypothetical protein llap_12775 [Limosa lapponica baueri]|uniref:Peptidase M12B domain-containing protein n=1 Tax=Limosa lapponica baueri TaxID=1758121 RepID=A0A2I0TSZ9_LIMLA|nr:hypothetical protein llap_12775 [Limosa lapponica baueri]